MIRHYHDTFQQVDTVILSITANMMRHPAIFPPVVERKMPRAHCNLPE
ncbi:MAG: hypothetical protein HXY35_04530 [Chloroflexi bacterium]|nr:hypothetical protein [Chloroflexota bacterium]